MAIAKVLLVDDDEMVRYSLARILEDYGFEITTASSAPEAIRTLSSENYDVLLSDLHMSGPGEGLTVVSAMRQANPRAVTLLLSGFPERSEPSNAILLQADEILVRPVETASSLVDMITQRLLGAPSLPRNVESVAAILEREVATTISCWHEFVAAEAIFAMVPLSFEQRTAHIPLIFKDLVARLRSFEPLGTKRQKSTAAWQHGEDRARAGYTAAMIVEESRFLQVSIFQILQNNLLTVDFSILLVDVMTIADEIDSQLSQTITSFLSVSRSRSPLQER